MTNKLEQSLYFVVRDAVIHVLKRNVELNGDTILGNEGVDSITTVRLLVQLEKKLNIQFREEDLTLDNFMTINTIVSMLDTYGVRQ